MSVGKHGRRSGVAALFRLSFLLPALLMMAVWYLAPELRDAALWRPSVFEDTSVRLTDQEWLELDYGDPGNPIRSDDKIPLEPVGGVIDADDFMFFRYGSEPVLFNSLLESGPVGQRAGLNSPQARVYLDPLNSLEDHGRFIGRNRCGQQLFRIRNVDWFSRNVIVGFRDSDVLIVPNRHSFVSCGGGDGSKCLALLVLGQKWHAFLTSMENICSWPTIEGQIRNFYQERFPDDTSRQASGLMPGDRR